MLLYKYNKLWTEQRVESMVVVRVLVVLILVMGVPPNLLVILVSLVMMPMLILAH